MLAVRPVWADVPRIDVSADSRTSVTHRFAYLIESEGPLTVGQVVKQVDQRPEKLLRPDRSILVQGIGSPPVWLVADVEQPHPDPVLRRIVLGIGWLDRVDMYLLRGDSLIAVATTGDRLPVQQRSGQNRFGQFDHWYETGVTRVLLRVETADPMVVPVSFSSVETSHAQGLHDAIFYSFIYGVVTALLLYNFLLFVGIRQRRYLFYTLYMGAFLAMNLSYTGLGMVAFWPGAVLWQQWAPPLFMFCFMFSGLAFATNFLRIARFRPGLYRAIRTLCLAYLIVFLVMLVANQQSAALLLAFSLVPLFSVLMLYMGVSSWRAGNRAARYFLLGTLASTVGASVTGFSVWGVLPFTWVGFRAVDIGMAIDAVLLVLALADLVRQYQEARQKAEHQAQVDPLTGLNNRRGFLPIARSFWSLAERQEGDICIAILDLDHFKEINDQYGHNTGDAVLRRIAAILNESKRNGDILGRWGGEEFIVALPDTTLDEAHRVTERFRRRVETWVMRERGAEIRVTVSIGVASRLTWHQSLNDLIVVADRQLYRAKSTGRNRVCAGGERHGLSPGSLPS